MGKLLLPDGKLPFQSGELDVLRLPEASGGECRMTSGEVW